MARPKPAHQHRVEAHRMGGIVRMPRQVKACRARHAAELAAAQRLGGGEEIGSCLDLDEGQDAAAPNDDVDLAELGLVAPRQQRLAGEPQAPHGAQFGDMAQPMGCLTRLNRHDDFLMTGPRA